MGNSYGGCRNCKEVVPPRRVSQNPLSEADILANTPSAEDLAKIGAYTGSYKLIKTENFDEYMSALGVSYVLRKLASKATPVTDIVKDGDNWTITTTTTFKTTVIKFQIGQEFNETTGDGRECKSVITMQGDNVLVHTQRCGGPPLRIFREFSNDEMTMILEAPGGVKSTRVYKKLE